MSDYQNSLSVVEIEKRIPHRFPFLLIDRVLHFEYGPDPQKFVGRKIIARKNVTMNEQYFIGHFPGNPLMPGVLQVEAMAQAGAIACVPEAGENVNVLIAKISEAKFKRQVTPGDVLEIHGEIIGEKRSILTVTCKTFCDGHLVSQANIMAKIIYEKTSQ